MHTLECQAVTFPFLEKDCSQEIIYPPHHGQGQASTFREEMDKVLFLLTMCFTLSPMTLVWPSKSHLKLYFLNFSNSSLPGAFVYVHAGV